MIQQREFALMGLPTTIIADDAALLAAACAGYADWADGVPELGASGIVLRLALGDGSSTDVSFAIRVEGSRLAIRGPAIVGEADARMRSGGCRVPRSLIDDPIALASVVDTLLLFLLARAGRTPLHAAGILHEGRALVLAGRSGSGKSTMALAAAARGLPILSDDTLYVQLAPHLRLWGFPRPIHVFPQDAPPGLHPIRERGGKHKAAVPVPHVARCADEVVLLVLERGHRLDWAPLAADEVQAALGQLDPGFDLLAEASATAIAALARRGAFRLTLAADPREAIEFMLTRLSNAQCVSG